MHTESHRVHSRRTFLRQAGAVVLSSSIISFSGCESLVVDPVISGQENFPFITPTDSFFAQFGADGAIGDWPGVQQIPRGTWRLAIDGLVSNPLSLSLADIDSRLEDQLTIVSTLRCILDNNAVPGLVGTATWTGVPLSLFLNEAGIDLQEGKRVRVYAADGFTNNLTLDKLYSPGSGLVEPLLVYLMNGSPLRPEFGAPVRLLVPGHYGYKSVKWIERIEVTDQDEAFGTYQEVLGYEDDGEIDVHCKSTSILQGARLQPGRTRIAGFALSGAASVEKILVSINDEPAREARIKTLNEVVVGESSLQQTVQVNEQHAYPYRGVWTQWELYWDASPGEHTISITALDAAGHQQPLDDPDPTNGQNPALSLPVFVES